MRSERGSDDRDTFFVELLIEVDALLSELILGRWRSRVTSKNALSDDKDEGDDPEAQQELAVVLVRPVSRNCWCAINWFVLSWSLRDGGKLANRVETEDGGDNDGAEVVKTANWLHENGKNSEWIHPDTERKNNRLNQEGDHGCRTYNVDVGPSDASRLTFSIAVAKQSVVFLRVDLVGEWSSLEVEVVERAIRAVDLLISRKQAHAIVLQRVHILVAHKEVAHAHDCCDCDNNGWEEFANLVEHWLWLDGLTDLDQVHVIDRDTHNCFESLSFSF